MEHKQTEATITAVDEAQGIVEAIWAVMGNVDDVGDIIHPGAFVKTFNERGNQIKLLDNHRTDSVMASLGLVKELREVKRAELPQPMMDSHPDVTGGAWGRFQFLLDTPEGLGAFKRIKSGSVTQWSFGYDAVDKDYSQKDGKSVRNLRGIKLYEVSPVLFPANSATTTTDAKAKPSEGKPYGVVEEDGQYCVYRLDADGKPMGKPMGKHPTEAEAEAQRRALYANEEGEDKATWSAAYINDLPDSSFLLVESGGEKDADGKTTPRSLRHLPYKDSEGSVDLPHLRAAISRLGQVDTGATGGEKWLTEEVRKRLLGRARGILENANKSDDGKAMDSSEMGKMRRMMQMMGKMMPMMEEMMAMMGDMMGGVEGDEHGKSLKAGRVLSARNAKRIKAAMDELHTCLMEAGLMDDRRDEPDDDANTGPHKAATPSTSDSSGSQPEPDGAGTDTDDSTRLLKLIELELEETEV